MLHLIGGASDQVGTREAGEGKPARCRTSFAAGFSLFLPCERGGYTNDGFLVVKYVFKFSLKIYQRGCAQIP